MPAIECTGRCARGLGRLPARSRVQVPCRPRRLLGYGTLGWPTDKVDRGAATSAGPSWRERWRQPGYRCPRRRARRRPLSRVGADLPGSLQRWTAPVRPTRACSAGAKFPGTGATTSVPIRARTTRDCTSIPTVLDLRTASSWSLPARTRCVRSTITWYRPSAPTEWLVRRCAIPTPSTASFACPALTRLYPPLWRSRKSCDNKMGPISTRPLL